MARRGSAKRNVMLFAIAVVVLAALIVIMPRLSRAQLVMPPESPETVARRLAPENAYFTLQEAVSLWPENLWKSLKPSTPGVPPGIKPAPGSLGQLLGISRPDDDPDLLEYLRQSEPALAKAREALTRPYYMLGIHWPDFAEYGGRRPWPGGPIHMLGATLVARGIQRIRSGGNAEEASRDLLDTVRLGLLVGNDGDTSALSTHMIAALALIDEFGRYASADLVRRVSNEIAGLSAQVKPPEHNLEFVFRILDNTVRASTGAAIPLRGGRPDRQLNEAEGFLWRIWAEWNLRSARRIVTARRDDLLAAVVRPYPEFMNWWHSEGDFSAERRQIWPFEYFLTAAQTFAQEQATVQAHFAGARLALALELYHKAHGAYPDALDALVPECIDALPADPFSGGSFLYERHDDDYLLYAVGINQKNDGKDMTPGTPRTRRRDDMIIHIPPSLG